MSEKTLKVKAPTAKVDLLMAMLAARKKRRKEKAGTSYEVAKSGDGPLSKVKYVLFTGIESLDLATGGLPFGRVIEPYGLEGCGKTALVWRACVRAHEHCIFEKIRDPKTGALTWNQVVDCDVFILYMDNEQSLDDNNRMVVDGVEITDAIIGRCDTIEDLWLAVEDFLKSVASIRAKTPDRLCFPIVVVDTVASTSTKKEVEAKWDDVDFPRRPQQIHKGMRRLTRLINTTNTLAIMTNQVNASFAQVAKKGGAGFVDPDQFISPGGRAVKFFASLRIFLHVYNSTYKLRRAAAGGPHGFVTKFTVVKNRQTKPWRSGRFVLLYDRGISDVFSKLETMVQLKLVERTETGAYTFRLRAAGITPETFKSEDDVKSSPKINSPGEWPAFYEAHKLEMDKLWDVGKKIMFEDTGAPLLAEDEDEALLADASPIDQDDDDGR